MLISSSVVLLLLLTQTQTTLNQHDQFITAATQQMMRLTTTLDNTNTSITNLHTQFITSQDKMNATQQQLVNNRSPNTGTYTIILI